MFRAEIVTTKGTKDTKDGGEFAGLARGVIGCVLEVHPVPGMEFLFVPFVPFVVASGLGQSRSRTPMQRRGYGRP